MTTKEYLEARKNKNWKFNNVVGKNAFLNVEHIHPLKQQQVEKIVQAAQNDSAVNRVIVFGSSIRYDCDITSDLDLCIDWHENCYDENGVLKPFTLSMRKVISDITHGNADVVNYGYLDSTVLKKSVEEGVIVYEHYV